ncbi:Sterigmatocystin 8-O-methyltransferase [Termitomyces sp. J132]|nr:Sterigmatocystin 8-O-methyltransferase [Termitomyces sp. J132]
MRLLATKHIFREVATDCFANNRLSLQLLSSNPLTNMVSEHSDATLMLADVLADPEWGNSEAFEKSPWNKLTGFEGSMFQYWKAPDGAPDGASFGIGMGGWNDAIQTAAVLADFPWGRYPPGTTVNDFGGGIGNSAMELIKTYPNLQLKLQDLPDRIHQAEVEVWPKLLPSAIAEKRIEFKAFDFLADSPIEGCDVYYLKNIIHDWPDNECIQILRNIRAVLKPGACILIHEYVLQHANHTDASSSTFTNAPEPMLPNYGIGRIRQYNCDIAMMVIHNGKERTLDNFIDIASKADLQFVKLWCVGEMSMVELRA